MAYNQFYLASSIPQWGIFIGIVCVIIGYIDKKEKLMTAGWIILIATGLISLFFNLTGSTGIPRDNKVNELFTAGWQNATGAVLAAATYFFQRIKNRYFKIMGILTVLYFMLVFFQFNSIMGSQSKGEQPTEQKDQPKKIIQTLRLQMNNFGVKHAELKFLFSDI
jgi:peptidoglycan/LPS O-acetylase OafA/YrhL